MARLGMEVDQVEGAAKKLTGFANELDALTGKIEALVQGLLGYWDGDDAQRFVNSEWPPHKRSLGQLKQQIDDLSAKATSNAARQRDISGQL